MSAVSDRLAAALADRYRIERELGQGGMATVYLAQDLKHDRKVALKVLKPELAAVLGAERFVVEIKTTAALQHPHILALFDSGTADGFLYYVMPFIQGETLREKLNRETQLGVDEAVRIATDVADALHYAHTQGVIHRDIKPENILLANGRPMVADFGIALAVSAAAGGRMTETGLSLGTPHYMSPEQATADKDITGRSDIYSLASVLYEMLAGVPPHEGGSAQQTIMRIITDTPRPVTELRKSVPPNVAAALARALEKLPADRFDSAKAFADALANPHFVGGVSGATVRGVASGRAARMRPAIPWTVAGLTTAAAIAFAVRGSPPATPQHAMRFTLNTPGIEITAGSAIAVSNDGQTIVFAGRTAGVTRLYVRKLADPVPRELIGTDGARGAAAISPDSRWVVFSSSDERVKRVPLDGGRVETLVHTTEPAGLTWNERLGPVLGMPMTGSEYRGLLTIPPRTDTTLTRLTLGDPGLPRSLMHHNPVALADGNTILYSEGGRSGLQLGVFTIDDSTARTVDLQASSIAGAAGDIVVYVDRGVMAARVDLKGRRVLSAPVRIPTPAGNVRNVVMSPTGTLAFVVTPTAYQAVLVDERGTAVPLAPDTVRALLPRFSPDGRRVLFSGRFHRSAAVWIYDTETQSFSKLNDGKPSATPIVTWSPDGRRFLNASRSETGVSYEWISVDGTRAPETLPYFPSPIAFAGVAVAPDERAFIIGTTSRTGGNNLMLRRPGIDSVSTPFVATDANEVSPSFSPDGRWVAYASDESGRYEVYVSPYPGPGPRVQISHAGGGEPVWARDGRRLFYRSGSDMMAAVVEHGGGALSVRGRDRLFSGDYFGGENTQGATYDVSPDGRRFVMTRSLDEGGDQLFVWTGWLDEVRRMLDGKEP